MLLSAVSLEMILASKRSIAHLTTELFFHIPALLSPRGMNTLDMSAHIPLLCSSVIALRTFDWFLMPSYMFSEIT